MCLHFEFPPDKIYFAIEFEKVKFNEIERFSVK